MQKPKTHLIHLIGIRAAEVSRLKHRILEVEQQIAATQAETNNHAKKLIEEAGKQQEEQKQQVVSLNKQLGEQTEVLNKLQTNLDQERKRMQACIHAVEEVGYTVEMPKDNINTKFALKCIRPTVAYASSPSSSGDKIKTEPVTEQGQHQQQGDLVDEVEEGTAGLDAKVSSFFPAVIVHDDEEDASLVLVFALHSSLTAALLLSFCSYCLSVLLAFPFLSSICSVSCSFFSFD